ncbi:MAG TPA: glycosyltransferase family 4 protein [Symbiobacteriaceae bacterium]|nr:glycosyltransferase family 4 protein [Symbiobacteriaceae bacterium]
MDLPIDLTLVCTEKLPVPPVRGGAIQTYIEGVLPRLVARARVRVITRTDPLLPDREERDGAEWIRLEADGYAERVLSFLRANPSERVVIYNRPKLAGAVTVALPAARIFLSLHNEMLAPDRIDWAEAEQLLARLDRVICISDFIRDGVCRLHPSWQTKALTIRSGVDLSAFQPGWAAPDARTVVRERLGLTDRRVILHVSRLSPKKGNHLVVAAMEQVLQVCPDATLLLVGSRWYGSNDPDEYAESILSEAARLGLGARITGWMPPSALPPYFLASDLFVCASQWEEPLARVHYEAMAAGLPILTTDRGGNGEVVTEGVNGRFVRPHDKAESYAQRIIELLEDPAERERLGRAGRAQVEAQHGWRQVGERLAERLLGAREGSG